MADSVEEVIYAYLNADTTLMAAISKAYWMEAEERATYPYVVFWMVDDDGGKTYVGYENQGRARIQFDLWDSNRIRGARIATTLKESVEALNESRGGYSLFTEGISQQTIQRPTGQDPYHFVVDGVINWRQ